MKYLLFTLLVASPSAWSALNMKPGLWKVDMQIKSEGKDIDPAGQSTNPTANMPEAEKQKLLSMMGKVNSGIGPTGDAEICYSKELIQKPEALLKPGEKCESALVTNTTSKIVSTFKCKDGTTGEATWNVKSADALMGQVNMRDPQGKKSQISYNGKFVQEACGKVKPAI